MSRHLISIGLAGVVMLSAGWARAEGANGAKGNAAGKAVVRQELLAKYDKNGNGKLDPDELAAAKADMAKKREKAAKGAKGLTAEAVLKKYDTNGDGKLDAAELSAMIKDLQAKRDAKKKAAT